MKRIAQVLTWFPTACPADPAIGKDSVNCDLTKGACSVFKEFDGTKLEYNENGAVFSIKEKTNAPTMGTKKFMFFGRLDVVVQPAAGAGIVTSLVLQSDDLDEVRSHSLPMRIENTG